MTHLATMNTTSPTMIETPCPGAGRRFVVEASNSDPATRRGNERDNLVEPDGTGPDGVPSWLRALRLI